jgi:hypothetical protein
VFVSGAEGICGWWDLEGSPGLLGWVDVRIYQLARLFALVGFLDLASDLKTV